MEGGGGILLGTRQRACLLLVHLFWWREELGIVSPHFNLWVRAEILPCYQGQL